MPIAEFQNYNDEDIVLTVSPWGDEHKIPPLARVGIRYTLKVGEEDRCYASISDRRLDFWCNADTYEIEVVSPSPYDRLLWRLAVGGWCGGIVNDKPTTVGDLLPATGMVEPWNLPDWSCLPTGGPKLSLWLSAISTGSKRNSSNI